MTGITPEGMGSMQPREVWSFPGGGEGSYPGQGTVNSAWGSPGLQGRQFWFLTPSQKDASWPQVLPL